MTGPSEPRVVAEVGGLAVAELGPLVLVIDRGTGPLATVTFVLGVVALVFGGFGAATLSLGATGNTVPPWWLSTIFLLIGVAFGAAAVAVVARIRGAKAKPLSDYSPVAVFDRANRVFVQDGVVLASLEHTRFQRKTQLGSSSAMLVAVTPRGTRILKRGNPFNGGIGNLVEVLTATVFNPS
jgi:hypothetical protein